MNALHGFRFWACIGLAAIAGRTAAASSYWVYFGSHQNGPDRGLAVARFDAETGKLNDPRFLLPVRSPSYFAISHDHRFLYAGNSDEIGGVSAYRVDPVTGSLAFVNEASAGGGDTCYVDFDQSGRYLLATNYQGGSVAVFALLPDGAIGPRTSFVQHTGHGVDPERQTHPYLHCVLVDPTNRFAIVTDLGTDRISVYPFNGTNGILDAGNALTVATAAGVGPRHVRLHPNGKWLYADTEMGSTVSLYAWDSRTGTLDEKQTLSTLPPGFHGKSIAAELRVHPDGRHLYVSNRGDNSLMVYSIDANDGRLALVQRQPSGGNIPRNFVFDPTGRWLICSHPLTNNVMVFAVDGTTGRLTPIGKPINLLSPYGVEFCPIP